MIRTRDQFINFELVVEWRHMKSAGNSGVFAWVPMKALDGLPPDQLPKWGIEVQMLDHGYRQWFRQTSGGKPDDWFTTNGDIFPVGNSKLETFEPRSPDGSRSFPRKELRRGVGEWNHSYVRAIDGEIRLWVNGEEVSGGRGADPRSGFLCLEAEGAPVEFRNIRVRELPETRSVLSVIAEVDRVGQLVGVAAGLGAGGEVARQGLTDRVDGLHHALA